MAGYKNVIDYVSKKLFYDYCCYVIRINYVSDKDTSGRVKSDNFGHQVNANSENPDETQIYYVQTVTINYLVIISKQYAHLQTMTQRPVNFQKNHHKIVGVAYTIYLVSKGT